MYRRVSHVLHHGLFLIRPKSQK